MRFIADFCAILGTGFLTQFYPSFKIFGIFKLIRVSRLSRMISKMNIPKDVKAIVTIVKLTFYLFLLIHMMACAWYNVCILHSGDIDEHGNATKWYPPLDWINYKQSELFTDDIGIMKKYLICLYHGVLIVGFNELGPVNTHELLIMTLMLLGCAIINA